MLGQKLSERTLRTVPVPSLKEDIDVLANKVHSVMKLLTICVSRFVRKKAFGGILS